jgi:uncharacterized protein YjbI with pentapeptide repeats
VILASRRLRENEPFGRLPNGNGPSAIWALERFRARSYTCAMNRHTLFAAALLLAGPAQAADTFTLNWDGKTYVCRDAAGNLGYNDFSVEEFKKTKKAPCSKPKDKQAAAAAFKDTDLKGADLSGADLSGLVFRGARLARANLSWANLSEANMTRSSLRSANLMGATLNRAVLAESDLSGADLTDAKATRANFAKSDLSGARFENAVFSNGSAQNAMLINATLTNAALDQTDFYRAQLKNATFKDADLSYANFRLSNLAEAEVAGAKFDDGTILPFDASYGESKGMIKAASAPRPASPLKESR